MLNASGDNLVLENGFRILNEEKGESADQITNYYTFF
jgi:hypothetical protein